MKRKLVLAIAVATCFPSSFSNADMQSSLQSWMSSGEFVNVNQPAAYQSQAGGYGVSLGGIRYRTPVQEVGNFGSIRTPKISGGCGGIDMDFGGFNFINKDQLIQQLRAIASNAKGMIFQMAIDTVSSMIGNNMKNFANKADFMNKLQMDSCQAASLIMNKVSDAVVDDNQEFVTCRKQLISKEGKSFDEAYRECSSGGRRVSTNNSADIKAAPEFMQGNLAWKIMMQDSYLSSNKELAVLLMNITGTYIKRLANNVESGGVSDNDKQKLSEYIPPWFLTEGGYQDCLLSDSGTSTCESENATTLRQLIVYGPQNGNSSIRIFQCNDDGNVNTEDGCPDLKRDGAGNVVYENIGLTMSKPLAKAYIDTVNSILSKILNKNAPNLTQEEINLISIVKGPIYRYMLASTTFLRQPQLNDPLMQDFLSALAEQMVAERMASLVEKIRDNMMHGKNAANDDEKKKRFLDNVEKVQVAFLHLGINAQKRMATMQKMQENTALYEKALVSGMTAKMTSRISFGN